MGYLLKYRTEAGETELAFSPRRRDDAVKHARAALQEGAKDVELLDNGQAIPKSDYAPGGRRAAAAKKPARKTHHPRSRRSRA